MAAAGQGLRAPLRLAEFRRLAGAFVVNEIGNWLGDVALALIVYASTGSTLATALLLLATRGLPALLAPILAARLELSSVRRVLPALYLVEAALFGVLALALPHVSWAVIVLIAALDGLASVVARALNRAATAAVLAPAGLLREGNAVDNLGFTVAAAAGPPAAGLLIALVGSQVTLAVDSATFLVAALILARGSDRPVTLEPDDLPLRDRLAEGLRFVRAHLAVRLLLAGQGAALICFTLVLPVEVALATDTLDAGSEGYGLLLAAWGIGMPIGGFLHARTHSGNLGRALGLSTLAIAVSFAITGAAPNIWIACAGAFLGGIGNAVQWVGFLTLQQELTPDALQGRLAALVETVAALAPTIGFALGGALAALAGPRTAYGVAAAGVGLVTAIGWLAARRIPPATESEGPPAAVAERAGAPAG